MSAIARTKLPPINPEVAEQLALTSAAASEAFSSASSGLVNVAAALDVAAAIEDLRLQLNRPEIRQRIVALQDTPLGFRTDKDPRMKNKKTGEYNQPYGWEVVRDCAIEGTLRGLQLVGNQINIISFRCYVTKEGFEYLIRKLKHVTDFKPIIGVPRNLNGGALIECEATWKQSGNPQSLKVTIPVKGDDFSGADQLIGKATRKFLKRCHEIMTGISTPEGDASDAEGAIEVEAKVTTTKRETPPPTQKPEPPKTEKPVGVTGTVSSPAPLTVAGMLERHGVPFSDFQGWLLNSGIYEAADTITSVDELPPDVEAELLRNNAETLKKCVVLHGKTNLI